MFAGIDNGDPLPLLGMLLDNPDIQRQLHDLVQAAKDYDMAPLFLRGEYLSSDSNQLCKQYGTVFRSIRSRLPRQDKQALREAAKSIPSQYKLFLKECEDYSTTAAFTDDLVHGLIWHLISDQYFDIRQSWEERLKSSRVLDAIPELENSIDKDGLVVLSDRMHVGRNGLSIGRFHIYYSPLLRRSFAGGFNEGLLTEFSKQVHRRRHPNCCRIAIDHTRLLPRAFHRPRSERDIWYGPRFSETAIDSPDLSGVAVLHRRTNTILDSLMDNVSRTEFYWRSKNAIKTVEIEEVSNTGSARQGFILNRYAHAERDTVRGKFRHMDFAVKVYDTTEYQTRLDARIDTKPKGLTKAKVLRIDGSVTLDEWLLLLAYFFRGNEMLMEYFDPEKYSQTFGQWNCTMEEWKAKRGSTNETNGSS